MSTLLATDAASPVSEGPSTGLMVIERLSLARDGLMALLRGLPADQRRGNVAGAPGIQAACAALPPGSDALVLLDAGLVDAGNAALRSLRAAQPRIRVLLMADQAGSDMVLQALAAGAAGVVEREAGFAELARAIAAVRDGGLHIPVCPRPAVTPMQDPPVPSHLTGRQQDVLRLLAEGRSTKDIARTLDLAVSTIKVHLAAVYRTFGARNRVEALRRAGVLPPVFSTAP